MKTLDTIKPGQSVLVTKLGGEGAVRRRIMDMGLTKGTKVLVERMVPLGDPMELKLRGYSLSIRKADAGLIEVI